MIETTREIAKKFENNKIVGIGQFEILNDV